MCLTYTAGVERPFIPQVLLEDCYALRGELEEHPSGNVVPVKSKLIKALTSNSFVIRSQLFERKGISESRPFFVVSVEEQNDSRCINETLLRDVYRLTDREIEITSKVSEGLKNSEIVEKLFISEITVKETFAAYF